MFACRAGRVLPTGIADATPVTFEPRVGKTRVADDANES